MFGFLFLEASAAAQFFSCVSGKEWCLYTAAQHERKQRECRTAVFTVSREGAPAISAAGVSTLFRVSAVSPRRLVFFFAAQVTSQLLHRCCVSCEKTFIHSHVCVVWSIGLLYRDIRICILKEPSAVLHARRAAVSKCAVAAEIAFFCERDQQRRNFTCKRQVWRTTRSQVLTFFVSATTCEKDMYYVVQSSLFFFNSPPVSVFLALFPRSSSLSSLLLRLPSLPLATSLRSSDLSARPAAAAGIGGAAATAAGLRNSVVKLQPESRQRATVLLLLLLLQRRERGVFCVAAAAAARFSCSRRLSLWVVRFVSCVCLLPLLLLRLRVGARRRRRAAAAAESAAAAATDGSSFLLRRSLLLQQ